MYKYTPFSCSITALPRPYKENVIIPTYGILSVIHLTLDSRATVQYTAHLQHIHEWNRLLADYVHSSSIIMFKNRIYNYLVRAGYDSCMWSLDKPTASLPVAIRAVAWMAILLFMYLSGLLFLVCSTLISINITIIRSRAIRCIRALGLSILLYEPYANESSQICHFPAVPPQFDSDHQ